MIFEAIILNYQNKLNALIISANKYLKQYTKDLSLEEETQKLEDLPTFEKELEILKTNLLIYSIEDIDREIIHFWSDYSEKQFDEEKILFILEKFIDSSFKYKNKYEISYQSLLSMHKLVKQIDSLVEEISIYNQKLKSIFWLRLYSKFFFKDKLIKLIKTNEQLTEINQNLKSMNNTYAEVIVIDIITNFRDLYKFSFFLYNYGKNHLNDTIIMELIYFLDTLLDIIKLCLNSHSMSKQYILYHYVKYELNLLKKQASEYIS